MSNGWSIMHHPYPPPFPPLAAVQWEQIRHFPQIKTIELLPALVDPPPAGLGIWFKNFPYLTSEDFHFVDTAVLVGKPVIAAFMGISVKTLKRWMQKYEEIPIIRGGHRCVAVNLYLLHWRIWRELQKVPESHYHAARAKRVAEMAATIGITEKRLLDTYHKQNLIKSYPSTPYIRIRRTKHYGKTVERLLSLLSNYSDLQHAIFP